MKWFRALAIITGYCLITGCPKNCIEAVYSFSLPVSFKPETARIKLGDTIFLQSSIPKTLENSDGRMITYDNVDVIGTNFGITKLISNPIEGFGAVASFSYFKIQGNIYNSTDIPSPERYQQIEWTETNTSFELNIGIIAKEKGLFYFYIGDALGKKRKSGHQCEKANFYTHVINQDQHLQLFQQWDPNSPLDGLNAPKMYCFEVE